MVALEADFNEVYHRDLRDLWRPNSGMTVRWVIDHFKQLSPQSRVWKHLLGDRALFSYQDHLTADVRDLLMKVVFFTSLEAQKGLKQSDWQKIINDIPEAPLRPGEKKELKFATKEELMGLFGGGGKPHGRRK